VTTRQTDCSLGGPIVTGDAWFFGAARVARNATGNPQSAQQASHLRALQPGYTPVDNDRDDQIAFVKGTWRTLPRQEVV
jgi:hypothetical protein